MKREHALTLQNLNCVLVNELQAHLEDLWQVHQVGIVEEFKDLGDALGVRVGHLLHEGLGSLPELFLCSLYRVLICRLYQGDYDIRVNLYISGVYELE